MKMVEYICDMCGNRHKETMEVSVPRRQNDRLVITGGWENVELAKMDTRSQKLVVESSHICKSCAEKIAILFMYSVPTMQEEMQYGLGELNIE